MLHCVPVTQPAGFPIKKYKEDLVINYICAVTTCMSWAITLNLLTLRSFVRDCSVILIHDNMTRETKNLAMSFKMIISDVYKLFSKT